MDNPSSVVIGVLVGVAVSVGVFVGGFVGDGSGVLVDPVVKVFVSWGVAVISTVTISVVTDLGEGEHALIHVANIIISGSRIFIFMVKLY